MAHAEQFDVEPSEGRDVASNAGPEEIRRDGLELAAQFTGCAGIGTATDCEERAQRLGLRLTGIEDSIRLAEMYLSASRAIEEMLSDSGRLLEKGRKLAEPESRATLASAFAGIKRQIDEIVSEAGFDGHNLAAGERISLTVDEGNAHVYEIDPSALSGEALGLSGSGSEFSCEADILAAMVEVEHAINLVRTRHTVVEMAMSVLASRANFCRDKIRSLRNTSRGLLAEDRAYGAVCDIAASRVGEEHAGMQSEEAQDLSHARALHETGGARASTTPPDRLDLIAKDLARLLEKNSYLTNWFKFEAGDTEIFTRLLSRAYGQELIRKARAQYEASDAFREAAGSYMATFEARIDDETGENGNRQAVIERLLKTDQGTVYVVLTRARNRV